MSRNKPLVINPFDSIVQEAARELGSAMDHVEAIKLEPDAPGDRIAWVSNKDLIKGAPGKQTVIHLCLNKIKRMFSNRYQGSFQINDPASKARMKDIIKDFLKHVVLPHEAVHIEQELKGKGDFGHRAEPEAEKSEDWGTLEKAYGITKKSCDLLDDIANRLESKGLIKEAYDVDVICDILSQLEL